MFDRKKCNKISRSLAQGCYSKVIVIKQPKGGETQTLLMADDSETGNDGAGECAKTGW